MAAILKSAEDTKPSFDTVLDTVCRRLSEGYARYLLRRIQELDEELSALEQSLDECSAVCASDSVQSLTP